MLLAKVGLFFILTIKFIVKLIITQFLFSNITQQDSGHKAEGGEDNEDDDPLIPRQAISLHSFSLGRSSIDGLLLID